MWKRKGIRVVDGVGWKENIGIKWIRKGLKEEEGLILKEEWEEDLRERSEDIEIGDEEIRKLWGEEKLRLMKIKSEDRGWKEREERIVDRKKIVEVGIFNKIKDRWEGLLEKRELMKWNLENRREKIIGVLI